MMKKMKKIIKFNITHPTINGWLPEWLYRLWEYIFCKRGFHLFDEVISSGIYSTKPVHYLYCDACGLIIYIHKDKVKRQIIQ